MGGGLEGFEKRHDTFVLASCSSRYFRGKGEGLKGFKIFRIEMSGGHLSSCKCSLTSRSTQVGVTRANQVTSFFDSLDPVPYATIPAKYRPARSPRGVLSSNVSPCPVLYLSVFDIKAAIGPHIVPESPANDRAMCDSGTIFANPIYSLDLVVHVHNPRKVSSLSPSTLPFHTHTQCRL